MATRRVRTGAGYVTDPGGGPAQWQVTYEEQEVTGAYVTDPGGGPDQWQYTAADSYAGHNMVSFAQDYLTATASSTPAGYTGTWLPATTKEFLIAAKIHLLSAPVANNWYLLNIGRGINGGAPAQIFALLDTDRTLNFSFVDGAAGSLHPTLQGYSVDPIDLLTDTTLHLSVNADGGAQEYQSVTPPAGWGVTFTTVNYSASLQVLSTTVGGGTVECVEGVDYTVTQNSPLKLLFNSGTVPFFNGLSDTCTVRNWLTGTVKLWKNGVRQKVVMTAEDVATDTTFTLSLANSNRIVIGAAHQAVTSTPPTYTDGQSGRTGGYLGYVDGGAGDVAVRMGFILFDTAKNDDPSTTSANGSDIDLSAFASGGLTPAKIFLGGSPTYSASDYNNGTNRGSAAVAFTMVGAATS